MRNNVTTGCEAPKTAEHSGILFQQITGQIQRGGQGPFESIQAQTTLQRALTRVGVVGIDNCSSG